MLAPVFPGCHVICRPATYHGIEPPPFLPSLDRRAGIEPALSLLVAGGDPGLPRILTTSPVPDACAHSVAHHHCAFTSKKKSDPRRMFVRSDRDSELLPTRQYSFARPRSFLLAPDTYAVRVTGDFKAAPGLTTARNDLSAFGGFARLRLTHLPLSGESSTIHQHGRQLARGDRTLQSLRRVAPPRRFFLARCASQSHANCLSSWSGWAESNPHPRLGRPVLYH